MKTLYIGYTCDVIKRLKQHCSANRNPELIYYEAYQCEKDARHRERALKYYGSAWRALKQRLISSLKTTA